MGRIPDTDEALIDYARLHADVWAGGQTPPVIGLSAQQLLDTEAATAEAEAADLAAKQAKSISRAATLARRVALDKLEAILGSDLDTIDAYAKATNDPGVYTLAQVTPPKEPAKREAPPKPVLQTPVQLSGGVLRVVFKVTTGGGAQYQIERRDTPLGGTPGEWIRQNTITEKAFDDHGVPFGMLEVQYRVRAQISSGPASEWSEPAAFSFGTQGSQPNVTAGSIEPVSAQDRKGAG